MEDMDGVLPNGGGNGNGLGQGQGLGPELSMYAQGGLAEDQVAFCGWRIPDARRVVGIGVFVFFSICHIQGDIGHHYRSLKGCLCIRDITCPAIYQGPADAWQRLTTSQTAHPNGANPPRSAKQLPLTSSTKTSCFSIRHSFRRDYGRRISRTMKRPRVDVSLKCCLFLSDQPVGNFVLTFAGGSSGQERACSGDGGIAMQRGLRNTIASKRADQR